jgi:dipeptidyl-peptidase-4
MAPSYPLELARTQGFTLGRPARFTIGPDGSRLLFLRTPGARDPVRCLWSYDVATGAERLLADPRTLADTRAAPSAQEQVRRERARDRTSGISDYTTDDSVRVAAFSVSGRLFVADAAGGDARELPARTPVGDPRLSPDGSTVAYLAAGGVRVIGVDGTGDRELVAPDGPEVTWGQAEHQAAESMGRRRGFWWAPGGARLAITRVDDAPVQVWYIVDPNHPEAPPAARRYPSAGTANADVSLWLVALDGGRLAVDWDRRAFEYLVQVHWDRSALLAVVQNRPQTLLRILTVDQATGRTSPLRENSDPAWTTIVAGVPAHTASGELIWTVDDGDTRHLTVGGAVVTPVGLQVAEVVGADGETVVFVAAAEPTERHLWTWSPAEGLQRLTSEPGWHHGWRCGGTTVVTSSTPEGASCTVRTRDGITRTIKDLALTSAIRPAVTLLRVGERELRTAVLFPSGHRPGTARLPVLMDPYGGPAAQRAVAARSAYFASQWLADQGFAVVIADGRGTPGRGPRWERTIHRNRDAVLDDQIEALYAAASRYPDLDLGRVGIRGWSAGGYLAALAVLRRPDVFHAAVAGAPVTDHLLYGTHWQERFLGDPRVDPEPYRRASIIADAPRLRRPLLLVHGLLDDNVYPVHTMRLSAALFAAGRPHSVLPLPAATHMTSVAETTAGLLVTQARFLLDSLSPVREIV